ncbi:MAG: hypothetical protein MRY79_02790 [Alphaproteobacteria bacterium]|nr:hypothetical protein [Alphaproteobacteria bacterium]
MALNKYFKGAVVATIVGGTAIGITGCRNDSNKAYQDTEKPDGQIERGFDIKLIKKGRFFTGLDDGMYEITIPGKRLASGKDTTCILVKEDRLSLEEGYAGLSYDFGTPKP